MTPRHSWTKALVLGLGVLCSPPVLAECRDGKTELHLLAPSGKTRVLCVADPALPGLEKAGIIVTPTPTTTPTSSPTATPTTTPTSPTGCPCEARWSNGEGAPDVSTLDLSAASCLVTDDNGIEAETEDPHIFYILQDTVGSSSSVCIDGINLDGEVVFEPVTIPLATEADRIACQTYLEDLGCIFSE